eukprot:6120859-Amphidinium_carterae.1
MLEVGVGALPGLSRIMQMQHQRAEVGVRADQSCMGRLYIPVSWLYYSETYAAHVLMKQSQT